MKEGKIYSLLEEDIRNIVTETIALYKIDDFLAKPQLTYREACDHYGVNRVKRWIKHGLLKVESQNGKGSKKYYSHKKIIQLSKEWHHYFVTGTR